MISKGCLCEPKNYTAPLLPPSIRNDFHRVKEKIVEYFLSAQKVLHQTVKRKIIVENCKLFCVTEKSFTLHMSTRPTG